MAIKEVIGVGEIAISDQNTTAVLKLADKGRLEPGRDAGAIYVLDGSGSTYSNLGERDEDMERPRFRHNGCTVLPLGAGPPGIPGKTTKNHSSRRELQYGKS